MGARLVAGDAFTISAGRRVRPGPTARDRSAVEYVGEWPQPTLVLDHGSAPF